MENTGHKYGMRRITQLIFIALGVLMIGFVIFSATLFNSRDTIIRWGGNYQGTWVEVFDDGSTLPISLPASREDRTKLHVQTILPDHITGDTVFSIVVSNNTQIYVNDKLKAYFTNSVNPLPGENVKSVFLQVQLGPDDAGKPLRILVDESKSDFNKLSRMYYGNSLGIMELIFRTHGIQFILAAVLAVFSIAIVAFGVGFLKRYPSAKGFLMMGVGFLSLSVWVMLDNFMFQYLTGIYFLDGVWGYLLCMLMLIPFSIYLNGQQQYRYDQLHVCSQLLLIVTFIMMAIMHFTRIASFSRTRLLMNGILGAAIIFMLITMISDAFTHHISEYKEVCIGLAGLAISGVIEVILVNLSSLRIDGVYLLAGLYFLLVMMFLQTIRRLSSDRISAEQASEASRMRAELLAGLSHEIRTPINTIMGMDEMILDETTQPSVSEYATNIKLAGQNLVGIVDDILDFSNVETGRLELNEQEYDIARILSDVVNLEELRAESKGLELRVNVDSFLPVYLYGDEKRIKQIVTNLVSNAVKFTDEGFIQLSVLGSRSYNSVGLTIRVEDTGIGIKDEDKDKLFKKFEHLDASTDDIEGIGLGLPITAHLVNMMHGKMHFDSIYGRGTVFTVELEQKIAREELVDNFQRRRRLYAKDSDNYRESFKAPDVHVLVVDDNEMNITVVRGLLKRSAVKVDSVLSGKEMLEAITKQHYDVIFLDHMMPEMNGIETLKRSKYIVESLCKETPVIAMTANAVKGAKEQYLHVGFDGYIGKPVDIIKLEKMLVRLLPPEKVIMDDAGLEEPHEGGTFSPDTKLVDAEIGLANCVDNYEFYKEVLTAFVKEMPTVVAQITGYYNKADIENYRTLAHGIKSSARVIGAIPLSEAARDLEAAANEFRTDYISENHEGVMDLYNKVVDYINTEMLKK